MSNSMNELHEFRSFSKIPRLNREIIITEKVDGTNACVYIHEDGTFKTGSRNGWITPEADNFGFSKWAHANKEGLISTLGPGRHFGEWYGAGINIGYGLSEKRFMLFNHEKYSVNTINGVSYVPVIYKGLYSQEAIEDSLWKLKAYGSFVVPGFMRPEGIVIYHKASRTRFKVTIEGDEAPKGIKTDA